MLIAHGTEQKKLDPALIDALSYASVPVSVVEMAPQPGDDEKRYTSFFGGRSDVFLVRPDGYVALAASAFSAPKALHTWFAKWLSKAVNSTAH
ncbi:hypothetical protein [Pantoea vagans]|uniref:aromatic-ring hydroxylase C-terminal domain-containing protein n=1 Tax=Pantoea vagans TaxID=470934 RepID=UPI0023B1ABFC|nr:hypothetical protein [Pantoea vagans]MDE8559429.1 hypothetical protein [Pantoea vagans]MDE8579421.1 hypothetical protein [Pantoea vagans]